MHPPRVPPLAFLFHLRCWFSLTTLAWPQGLSGCQGAELTPAFFSVHTESLRERRPPAPSPGGLVTRNLSSHPWSSWFRRSEGPGMCIFHRFPGVLMPQVPWTVSEDLCHMGCLLKYHLQHSLMSRQFLCSTFTSPTCFPAPECHRQLTMW